MYDFKYFGYDGLSNKGEYYYRGMPFGINPQNGNSIYASARDIGNFAAGYITAAKGMSWMMARSGFDAYQSLTSGKLTTEGISTQNAQILGYMWGVQSLYNSFIKPIVKIKKYLFD